MAVAIWPADLPQRVNRPGFSEGLADGRLRTPMDAGLPKVRRRFSAAGEPVQASIDTNLNGRARFLRFWGEETGGGAKPFLLPDPLSHGVPLTDGNGVVLTDDAGAPILVASWWLCLFGERAPEITPLEGPNLRIAFAVTVMP